MAGGQRRTSARLRAIFRGLLRFSPIVVDPSVIAQEVAGEKRARALGMAAVNYTFDSSDSCMMWYIDRERDLLT